MEIVRKMLIPTKNAEPTECMVELDFDVERCMKYMAEVAWRNKSKRSKFGYVKVRVYPTTNREGD
jgi:hypothetical protein